MDLTVELCSALPVCRGGTGGENHRVVLMQVSELTMVLEGDAVKFVRFFFSLGFLLPGLLNSVLSVLPNISEHIGKTFSPAPPRLCSIITQLLS